jgi:Tfp pilus assembly protein PilV
MHLHVWTTSAVAPSVPRVARRGRLADESGFTLVEIMTAAFVLVVGLLGILTMLTRAMATTSQSNERVGATNVARELAEAARGVPYDSATPAALATSIKAKGLGSGTPWTLVRRGVTYTITVAVCTLDSPADGIETTPPPNICTPALTSARSDLNGDDFRRVTFTISWTQGTTTRSATQTELIVNPSGGLGPRIRSVSPLTQTITGSATNTATVNFTTSPAASVLWHADDGQSSGAAVLSPTTPNSWRVDWPLGTSGSGSEVLDGTYSVIAQGFDDRSIAGDAKLASVVLNRRRPYAPPSLKGGYNSRLSLSVDLAWGLNSERDIAGYRVYWVGLDGVVGLLDFQVCPALLGGTLSSTTSSCTQLLPSIATLTKYYVVALDRDSTGALREGDARTWSVDALGLQPNAPNGPLTATTVGGKATISWSQPSGPAPNFYRIYRDGNLVADRYDTTTTTTWTDSAADTAHDYWITAVDDLYNESNAIGPVRWSP